MTSKASVPHTYVILLEVQPNKLATSERSIYWENKSQALTKMDVTFIVMLYRLIIVLAMN